MVWVEIRLSDDNRDRKNSNRWYEGWEGGVTCDLGGSLYVEVKDERWSLMENTRMC